MADNKVRVGIVGNIGVGKSSLVQALGNLNPDKIDVYQEDVDTDGVLKDVVTLFYASKESEKEVPKIELANQLSFHLIAVLQDFLSKYSDKPIHVFDRIFPEHMEIFAYNNLDTPDYVTMTQFTTEMRKVLGVEQYDYIFMLDCDIEENINRVKRRGRDMENNEETYEYIRGLAYDYKSPRFERQLKQYGKEVIRIDTTHLTNNEVLRTVLDIFEEKEELKVRERQGEQMKELLKAIK